MIYMFIDIILYYKIKIHHKLVKLIEMGCLLSVYPEVIRSAIGRLKGAIGKGLRIRYRKRPDGASGE